MSDTSCYHCGLPVPAGLDLRVRVGGQARVMCCPGCQAVAETIVAGGLEDYYARRDAMPDSRSEALPSVLQDSAVFDHPAAQKDFVSAVGEHEREAMLILEGVTCPACVWLNERHVARLPGVSAVNINYTTRRARVRWDARQIALSAILDAIAAIGYRAHPYDASRAETLALEERKLALWRLFVAGFGMMQVMMYAVPVYLAGGDMTPDIEQLMRWASLILTLPVVLYSSAPFFRNAARDLLQARVGMDVPVALGVGVAFIASAWATLTNAGEVYFDSVTMFVCFLLAGRYLEMVARQKAARGVEELDRAQPALAFRLLGFPSLEGGHVAACDLAPGDAVLVKPGEAVPADGVVINGCGSADESLLNGESRPVAKRPGERLIGGSINGGSPLVMEVSAAGEATRLAAIRRLMTRASIERPQVMELADRIAAAFVWVLLALAISSAIAWQLIDPERALWIFVAVLVVSCPCALSLATPAALTVATGALAGRGMLVAKSGAIETLASATHFVFDKTGTLTEGRPQLLESWFSGNPEWSMALAVGMERGSEHPLAKALLDGAGGFSAPPLPPCIEGLHAVTGAGMQAMLGGRALRLGRTRFAQGLHGLPLPPQLQAWQAQGDTVIALADANGWRAGFRLGDRLRPEAAAMVQALKRMGAQVSIFSGDDAEVVRRIGNALDIADARGGMSPEEKYAAVCRLQREGGIVAMSGDGVNDAPVLAQAQVSIAMGKGADLARSRADLILLGDDLGALADGVALSKHALRIVRQNLAWAFAYNILSIPLAMAGLVTPWLAGLGMSLSSLLVVGNALRLRKQPQKPAAAPALALALEK